MILVNKENMAESAVEGAADRREGLRSDPRRVHRSLIQFTAQLVFGQSCSTV